MDRGAKFYVAGVAAWLGLVILFPVWHAAGYWQDERDPSVWRRSRSLGSIRGWAPIWSPPAQEPPVHQPRDPGVPDDDVPAPAPVQLTVRWPWQTPSHAKHLEPIYSLSMWIAGAGVIVFGVALRLLSVWKGRPTTGLVDLVSLRVALCLLAAAVVVYGLILMSGGYLAEHPVVTAAFFVALVLGVLLGVSDQEKQRGGASRS
jgi:hypothetical protein